MESSAAATAGMSYTKLTFEYDWQGKRIARHVWRGGTSGSPTFLNSRRWLYEGWNPVAEFTGTSDTAATGSTAPALNRYTWGLDLGENAGCRSLRPIFQAMQDASLGPIPIPASSRTCPPHKEPAVWSRVALGPSYF